MSIVNIYNKKRYCKTLYGGKACVGKYIVSVDQFGQGIIENLGKSASKAVFGSVGKSVGGVAGAKIGDFVKEKTGSDLLGKIVKGVAKSSLGFLGQHAGKQLGTVLSNVVMPNEKKKKKDPSTNLENLMNSARQRLLSGGEQQQGNGMYGAGMQVLY